MKFCQRQIHNYIGVNGVETSAHFVTVEDVVAFHGQVFADKWLDFIKSKPVLKENCYYYDDYKFAVRQTDSYLNPIS